MPSWDRIKQLMERFDGLSLRDRAALSAAVAVVMFFLVTVTLIAPDTIRRRESNAKLTGQKNELIGIQTKMGELTMQMQDDPVARQQVRRVELRKQIQAVDQELALVEREAPRIGSLVRDMLATNPGVSLVSVKTLPVQVVIQPTAARPTKPTDPNQKPGDLNQKSPAEAATATGGAGVYRHGIEVSLRGNYMALLPYLEKLQRSSARLTWSDVRLDATPYPDAVLTIVVFTLSGQQSPSLG